MVDDEQLFRNVVRWWVAQKRLPELYQKIWAGRKEVAPGLAIFLFRTPGYRHWFLEWKGEKLT